MSREGSGQHGHQLTLIRAATRIHESLVILYHLSHDVASGSEITLCNKIDKPLSLPKNRAHAINSHVFTDKTPCINQAIQELLVHGFCIYIYAF